MPAALPIAAAVVPGILGAVVSNGDNKANQKNATNAAASANQQDQQALTNALARLQAYTQSNPSPTANAAPIQGPASTYGQSSGTMGGGTVGGANGGTVTPPAAQTQQAAAMAPANQGQGAVNVNSGVIAQNPVAAQSVAQTVGGGQSNPVMTQAILAALKNAQGNGANVSGDNPYASIYKNMNGGIKPISPNRSITLGSAL
jgi:hypothetical protein